MPSLHKELNIIGSFAQTHAFDQAIQSLQLGLVKVDGLITHRFPFERFQMVLEQVERGQGQIKVIIDWQRNP